MSTRTFWEIIGRRWWWLVVGLIAGLGLASAALIALPRTYQSEAAILVDAEATNGDVTAFSATTYVDERLPTYVDLGRADAVQDDIRDRLGRDLSRDQLEAAVAYVPTPGSMVISVTGTGATGPASQRTADAAAQALATAIDSTSTESVVVTTSLVQNATLPSRAEDPDPLVLLPAGGVVGLLIPLLLALTTGPRHDAAGQEGNER